MNLNFLHNFRIIKKEIKDYSNKINLIVVTKNQKFERINYLITEGHKDFGENKVQEAKLKWVNFLNQSADIKLHFIGRIQSNKIHDLVHMFEFIHSLDCIKKAKLFALEELKISKKLKYFIQVNIAKEIQKSGIQEENLDELIKFCKDINLNVIGLMCIPPIDGNTSSFFKKLKHLSSKYSLSELSMGMSNDYKDAISNGATYIRIGSAIFNKEN
jgi:pyridoxal phosphate enzyme (YggS family)